MVVMIVVAGLIMDGGVSERGWLRFEGQTFSLTGYDETRGRLRIKTIIKS